MSRRSFEGIHQAVADDVVLGKDVRLSSFVNLYGCEIGDEVTVGAFVEIQKGAKIGARAKIGSHTFICEGVSVGKGSFIGHGVTFINDRYPRALTTLGEPQDDTDWEVIETEVGERVSIGSGSTILCGVKIGDDAMIGAGSLVTRSIPAGMLAMGSPATPVGPSPDFSNRP